MSKFTQQEIDALKASNPEIYRLRGKESGIEVIVKPCGRANYQRAMEGMGGDSQKRRAALKQLLLDCLLAPTPAELETYEERYPGSIIELGYECRLIAGGAEEIVREKL